MIEGLIDKGFAYPAENGDVIFACSAMMITAAFRPQNGRYAGRFAH
jgi:cysteinyl-tRNA synthetase